PRRLVALFLPNGMVMNQFTPASAGAGFALTPILQPLAPIAAQGELTVVTNLGNSLAAKSVGLDQGHEAETATFMTCVQAALPGAAGISFDQVAANALAPATRIPSLQLGNSTASYNNHPFLNLISWADASTPLPKLTDPRAVFDRLFPTAVADA